MEASVCRAWTLLAQLMQVPAGTRGDVVILHEDDEHTHQEHTDRYRQCPGVHHGSHTGYCHTEQKHRAENGGEQRQSFSHREPSFPKRGSPREFLQKSGLCRPAATTRILILKKIIPHPHSFVTSKMIRMWYIKTLFMLRENASDFLDNGQDHRAALGAAPDKLSQLILDGVLDAAPVLAPPAPGSGLTARRQTRRASLIISSASRT